MIVFVAARLLHDCRAKTTKQYTARARHGENKMGVTKKQQNRRETDRLTLDEIALLRVYRALGATGRETLTTLAADLERVEQVCRIGAFHALIAPARCVSSP